MKRPKRFRNWKLNHKFTFVIILSLTLVIGIFAAVLFYIMEQNTVNENYDYMRYSAARVRDNIGTRVSSIQMSTQYFESDEKLLDILNCYEEGGSYSAAELMDFKTDTVASLERLVNNNPLLYGVRVYAENDEVQEVMPILYRQSRMRQQEWEGNGWHFDYTDNVFSSYHLNREQRIVSLVTEIEGDRGRLGSIEAAMTMEEMFPGLYEEIEDEWSCLVTADGATYCGSADHEMVERLLPRILEQGGGGGDEIVTNSLRLGDQYLIVSFLPLREMDAAYVYVKDITDNVADVHRVRNTFVALMALLLVLLALFINRVVKRLLGQFYRILQSVRQVRDGDLSVRVAKQGDDEMGELADQLNAMLDEIARLMQENIDREVLAKNSQIRALQNQINAHFIYNVLETIKMMAEIDEEYAISDAVTALGKLLRYSMHWTQANVTVAEELEYIRNYVALINLRFDYTILLSLKLPPEVMEQEIPKMTLQPIVENAILHGVEELAEDSTVYLKGWVEGEDCVIEITDNGSGMNAEQVDKLKRKISGAIESSGGSGNGIGLKNVQDRITIAFGSPYGLDIVSQEGKFTKVIVRLPKSGQTVGKEGEEK